MDSKLLPIVFAVFLLYRPLLIYCRNGLIPWFSIGQITFVGLMPLPYMLHLGVSDRSGYAWVAICVSCAISLTVVIYRSEGERLEVSVIGGRCEIFSLIAWFIVVLLVLSFFFRVT